MTAIAGYAFLPPAASRQLAFPMFIQARGPRVHGTGIKPLRDHVASYATISSTSLTTRFGITTTCRAETTIPHGPHPMNVKTPLRGIYA